LSFIDLFVNFSDTSSMHGFNTAIHRAWRHCYIWFSSLGIQGMQFDNLF